MQINRLWLTDFRNYESLEVEFSPGLTAISGDNGHGKSNLLEAVSYVLTKRSFRGATGDALVRVGADVAIVRAEAISGDREMLIEMEIPRSGRGKTMVNKKSVVKTRDLSDHFAVSVFSPDDLSLIKGGPAERRAFIDGVLASIGAKYLAFSDDYEAILKQRNSLLRNAGGYLNKSDSLTLDVLDEQLTTAGEQLVGERERVTSELELIVGKTYDEISEASANVVCNYKRSWDGDLMVAISNGRDADLRRGTSTVGPHRDDIEITIAGLSSRTQASQGEQRTLVLALRLAAHRYAAEIRREQPILLLDDVFSELDPGRASALVRSLQEGQSILTSAGSIPDELHPTQQLQIENGKVK